MFKKSLLVIFILFIILILFQYFNIGSPNEVESKNNFEIVAHRGVHQHYIKEGKDIRKIESKNQMIYGCEARKIVKFTHNYIENTIESIQAAFNHGATIVEIDIRPTKDNRLVVFHDEKLDCKTNGKGKVSDFTAEELEKLDVGYGYTSDNGKTFPLRGTGVSGIKTLNEVLRYFPNKKFLIDNKNGNNLKVAQLIVDVLFSLPKEQQKKIYLWTQNKAYKYIHGKVPSAKKLLLTRKEQKILYKSYIFSLGLFEIPKVYRGEGIGMTKKYIKYIWGWPYKFLGKVKDADVRFYIYANNQTDFDDFSKLPVDGILTDYIEIIDVSR